MTAGSLLPDPPARSGQVFAAQVSRVDPFSVTLDNYGTAYEDRATWVAAGQVPERGSRVLAVIDDKAQVWAFPAAAYEAPAAAGSAGGDLSGSYPDPVIAAGSVTVAKTASGATGLALGSFSGYRAAASSLASGAVIGFDTEEWDVSGWHDVTTNKGRFTPLLAGYYALTARVGAGAALTTDEFWVAQIAKNGTAVKSGMAAWQRANTPASTVTALVAANGTTDYFEVLILHGHASPVALDATAAGTFFQGHLIGKS